MVSGPRLRVAVIGTGIAGNVAAYHLSRLHDVTVYEANNYIGGHTNTVSVATPDGDLPVDTGFIVFNNRTYPNFINLLDELDVPSQESEMSFSVRSDAATARVQRLDARWPLCPASKHACARRSSG